MRLPSTEATSTPFPQNTPLTAKIPDMNVADLIAIGQVAGILIDINLGNFQQYAQQLDIWNAILEMRSTPVNIPWEGASHLVKPTVFTAYNEFVSRVVGSCLVPRPYMVRGNDPIANQYANAFEQFLNGEWERNNCFPAYDTAIQMGARDGTVVMEVLYDLKTHSQILYTDEPQFDGEGAPLLDSDGQPLTKRVPKLVTFVDYDAPREVPVDLKSILLFPVFATDVNSADGVARKTWMTERDIQEKVAAGIFNPDVAEQVLSYVQGAMGEKSTDPQGNSQYTVSGRLPVVDTAVAPPLDYTMSRGPVEIWRIHTNLFDFDGDGIFEENVLWYHYNSRSCLGVVPFDYLQGRPFFPLSMIPRPGLFYGFSIPEIGRSTQEEVDVQTNARLNLLDLSVKPGRWHVQGVRYKDNDKRWGPDIDIETPGPGPQCVGFLQTPPVPEQSMVESQDLVQVLDRAVGAPQAAAIGVPPGGGQQRSARAAQLQAQIMGMQSNLVFTRVRRWMLDILKYKVGLYRRYAKAQMETVSVTQNGPQKVVLPREVLNLDYSFTISGLGGAIDKEARRQDMAMLTQLMLGTPLSQLFAGNLPRLWNLARLNLETYDVPEVTSIIGTLDEAMAHQQAMGQAQQSQQMIEALMQVLSHQGTRPHGAPSGEPHRPAQPTQPQQPPAA